MFLNQLINAIIQVGVFLVIPFVWWFISARRKENFRKWIGLKKPAAKSQKRLLAVSILIFLTCWGIGELAVYLRGPMEAADSVYKGMGWSAFPSVLAYSFIQTAFSEELLFRGFLLKRLSARFGFKIANIMQAVIFGFVHLLMVWGQTGLLSGIVIVIYPMAVAVGLSYLNEREAGGSMIPSWLVHGFLNTCSTLLVLF